jgi:hypothetical protein
LLRRDAGRAVSLRAFSYLWRKGEKLAYETHEV